MKKVLVALALVALIVCGAVIAIFADSPNYSGRLEDALIKLALVQEMETPEDKIHYMNELSYYLQYRPIDPITEGYEAFTAAYDAENLFIIANSIASINEIADLTERKEELIKLNEYLDWAPFFNPDSEDVKAVRGSLSESAFKVLSDLLYIEVKQGVDALNAGSLLDEYLNAENKSQNDNIQTLASELRSSNYTLHAFFSLCIEPDMIPESIKADYDALMIKIKDAEFTELKALIANYFSLAKADAYLGQHIALNTAADRITACIKSYQFSSSIEGYAGVMTMVNEVKTDIASKNAAQKSYAENQSTLSEHYLTAGMKFFDFSNNLFPDKFNHSNSTATGAGNLATDTYELEGNGNRYLSYNLGLAKGQYGNSAQQGSDVAFIDLTLGDTTRGIVVEMDIMSTDFNFVGLKFTAREYATNGAGRYNIYFNQMNIANNSLGAFTDVMTPGEWTHVVWCYTPDDGTGVPAYTLYIDYEWIGAWYSCKAANPYILYKLRITPGFCGGNVSFDNIQIYQGTGPRDVDALQGISDDDAFRYYVNAMYDTTYSYTNRIYAMNKADLLLSKVAGNLALADDIQRFNSFNPETEVLVYAREDVYNELCARIETLSLFTPVTSVNISDKTKNLTIIEKYFKDNAAFIIPTEQRIVEIRTEMNKLSRDIKNVNNVSELIYAFQRFDRATTYKSMVTHYADIVKCYEKCELEDGDNYIRVKEDPLVSRFETTHNCTLMEFYASTVGKMQDRLFTENSMKIVDCVNFITSLDGYEDTELFWSENSEEINIYIVVIRKVLESELYDENYDGLEEAMNKFNVINPYFYAILQSEHANVIRAQLDKYLLTDSYIEKLGYCAFVEKYINENDIQEEHGDIAPLLEKYYVYKAELEAQREQYNDVIEQNPVYFINLVNQLDAYVKYSEFKPVYAEALSYYHAMNTDTAEAQDAIDRFLQYQFVVEDIEASSAMLIGYANQLKKTTKIRDIYPILVKCSAIIDRVEPSISGVENALKIYNEKLTVYNEATGAVNTVVDETANLTYSVRSYAIHESILDAIKNILKY